MIGLMMLAFLVAPAVLLFLTISTLPPHGRYRWWSSVPWIPVAIHAAWIASEVARKPTSHNLFPFELGMSSAAGLVIFAILYFARVIPRVPAPNRT